MKDGYHVNCTVSSNFLLDKGRVAENLKKRVFLLFYHIITNRKENLSQYGVIPIGLSDHMLIYCTRRISRGHFKNRHSTKIRSLKNYSPEKFHNHLCEADWKPCFSSTCVDSAWKTFQSIFLSVLNEIAPIKEIRLKQRTEPWMTSNILDMIKERDSYLYKFRKSGLNDDYKYFKEQSST